MKKHSYTFSIPKPCSESWQNMSVTDKGKFCQSCEKEVIDFSVLTDEQIVKLIEKSTGKLCGRFKSTQLNRPVQLSYNIKRQYPLKSLLAGMMVLSLLPSCDEAPVPVKPVVHMNSADSIQAYKALAMLDDTVFFTGRVLNENDRPVLDAKVSIEYTSIEVPVDHNGRFVIAIPDTLLGREFKIEINSNTNVHHSSVITPELSLANVEQVFYMNDLVKKEKIGPDEHIYQRYEMGDIVTMGAMIIVDTSSLKWNK